MCSHCLNVHTLRSIHVHLHIHVQVCFVYPHMYVSMQGTYIMYMWVCMSVCAKSMHARCTFLWLFSKQNKIYSCKNVAINAALFVDNMATNNANLTLNVIENNLSSPRGAWAFDESRRYHTRPSRFNWGPENVHFGKTLFRDLNIDARISLES